mmetsp:Transcript_13286/g.35613  ORF Transcript_13286/g.35613 Transcript_13286/m.35613 type:complete len:237 (-) Transcript_13286:378-1088(-)
MTPRAPNRRRGRAADCRRECPNAAEFATSLPARSRWGRGRGCKPTRPTRPTGREAPTKGACRRRQALDLPKAQKPRGFRPRPGCKTTAGPAPCQRCSPTCTGPRGYRIYPPRVAPGVGLGLIAHLAPTQLAPDAACFRNRHAPRCAVSAHCHNNYGLSLRTHRGYAPRRLQSPRRGNAPRTSGRPSQRIGSLRGCLPRVTRLSPARRLRIHTGRTGAPGCKPAPRNGRAYAKCTLE